MTKSTKKITQDILVARLQIVGLDIDRTAGGRFLKDSEVLLFAEALKIPVGILFESVPEIETT